VKTNRPKLLLAVGLTIVLAAARSGKANAQVFTTLYTLTPAADGSNPGALILSGTTLYGTAGDGSMGSGTVFSLNTDGTGFVPLYTFTAVDPTSYTNGDGAYPQALVLSGNTLYGAAGHGGSAGNGTLFAVNSDGTGFTPFYSFTAAPADLDTNSGAYGWITNYDGAIPSAVALGRATLYGTANYGGSGGNGTVFAINTDGTSFKTLHNFAPGGYTEYSRYTNSDGVGPDGLILSGSTIYGTTSQGGASAKGTIFKVNTDGTGFAILHTFGASRCAACNDLDGGAPTGALVLGGNTLFGTGGWGRFGYGTLFAVNTDGTGFRVLHTFTIPSGSPARNADGASPLSLVLAGNTLCGTARSGGANGDGTVFSILTDGSGFSTLSSLAEGPSSALSVAGGTLYGATYGSIYALHIPSRLTITPAGGTVILSWPTNATGFTLQSTTNLASPEWTTNLPTPVVVDGQNTVTNTISGTQQFFRLNQ
jgi:uncharacterized repeat protein (TIGR03803 family)